MISLPAIRLLLLVFLFSITSARSQDISKKGMMVIKKSTDFTVSGDGSNKNWKNTDWLTIPKLTPQGAGYATKVKMLYSKTGIYVLFFCEDKKITATMQSDFLDLWNEDVIEIFLQPDTRSTAYFEYEVSPLNYELPITIFNEKGTLNSWIPFHYEGDRKTQHKITVRGGAQKSKATIESWTSEIFIPYKLLRPLLKDIPASGTRWRGNLYRIDYDKGEALWAWQRNSGNFHEYDKFGIFQFE